MDVQDIQSEARALGDPTRYSLFRYIVDSEQPVGVAELTAYVQLNHNAIRQHLAVLKEAQLVVEEIEVRDTPGRPRLLYRLHPEAAGKWETRGPYTWLAGLLIDAVKFKRSPRQVGTKDGLRRGLEYSTAGDPVDAMEQELVQSGFRPSRSERGSGRGHGGGDAQRWGPYFRGEQGPRGRMVRAGSLQGSGESGRGRAPASASRPRRRRGSDCRRRPT